jgi:hypothetical protein
VTEDRRLLELREEEEVLAYVREHGYIPLPGDGLPEGLQRFARPIDRLASKGVLIRLSKEGKSGNRGARWALTRPWRS